MVRTVVFIFVMFLSLRVFPQDVIILTNGTKVDCKVISTDSSRVYVSFYKNNNKINSFIDKTEVQEIKYGGSDVESNTVLTIGLLEGGGSLVGADAEVLLYKNLGFQVGVGFLGYGGGLNIHIKPHPRSSFFSVQYYHQGIMDSFVQSLMGPCFVYRGKKWFTAQLGVGFTLKKGPQYPESWTQTPVMLTYAIGFYFL